MAGYFVYNSASAAAAKPVLRWGDCALADVALQASGSGETAVAREDLSIFEQASDTAALGEAGPEYFFNPTTLALTFVARPEDATWRARLVEQQIERILERTAETQTLDASLSVAKIEEWAVYRQEVRDVIGQAGFPASVTWPTPPAGGHDVRVFQRLFNRLNILSPVATVLGIPVGGIIERGPAWTRYASGIAECWGSAGSTDAGDPAVVTMPISFIATNYRLSLTPIANLPRMGTAFDKTLTDFKAQTFDFAGNRSTVSCDFHAIGRWD